jgi:hypothetical protein
MFLYCAVSLRDNKSRPLPHCNRAFLPLAVLNRSRYCDTVSWLAAVWLALFNLCKDAGTRQETQRVKPKSCGISLQKCQGQLV